VLTRTTARNRARSQDMYS